MADARAAAEQALHMATFSLLKMSAGGMSDQVGGGFHRYSVGEPWHQGLILPLKAGSLADVWGHRGVLPHCSSHLHVMGLGLTASYSAADLPASTAAVLTHAQPGGAFSCL